MILQLVARVSSRVFVGPELCTDEDWLDVSVNYTTHAMIAADALSRWPAALRRLVCIFLPEVRKVRKEFARAREILEPVFHKRREQNRKSRQEGEVTSKTADTIGWFDEVAKGRSYDDTRAQLGLSFAAIHTTSELVSGIITDLCDHPEWFGPLRAEMSAAIQAHGWSKKALQEMRLTDSLMKESQRHHFGDLGESPGNTAPGLLSVLRSNSSSRDAPRHIRRGPALRRKPHSEGSLHYGRPGHDGRHLCLWGTLGIQASAVP